MSTLLNKQRLHISDYNCYVLCCTHLLISKVNVRGEIVIIIHDKEKQNRCSRKVQAYLPLPLTGGIHV